MYFLQTQILRFHSERFILGCDTVSLNGFTLDVTQDEFDSVTSIIERWRDDIRDDVSDPLSAIKQQLLSGLVSFRGCLLIPVSTTASVLPTPPDPLDLVYTTESSGQSGAMGTEFDSG